MNARILEIESAKIPYQISLSNNATSSTKHSNLRRMSDTVLLAQTKSLVQAEREILTDVLLHLAEIQKRKAFSPQFQSLTDYAIRELGYSEDEAARRVSAMKLLTELPEIEDSIADGSLKLSTLNLARTHFRNEAKQIQIDPAPTGQKPRDILSRISKIEILTKLKGKSTREATRTLIEQSSTPEKLTHFESVKPVSSTMNEVKILADDETLNKIAQLKGLLAHKHPQLTNGELVSIALDMAIAQLDPARAPKRKSNSIKTTAPSDKTAAPRFSNSITSDNRKKNSRYVPALINRELWQESGGKCKQCGSTHALERDHIKPFALGGETSKENLRLLCRNCNQRQAIRVFGRRET